TRSCYTGPAGSLGKGICTAGVQTCLNGTWGVCVGEVTPQTEVCNELDDDCDGIVDNGFDLQHDVNNCGTCGHQCFAPHATSICANGQSGILACAPGFSVCSGCPTDGCEVQTSSDPNNCGGCGIQCAAGQTCASGVCQG